MGFFDVYDDRAYLNQIFLQNNMAAINEYINQNGITDIENWKNNEGKDIASQWASMPDDSETALLRAMGESGPAMTLKRQWQQELHRRLRVQRREYSATQNNFNGPVYNGPVHYGDSVSITNGDYVKGDKNITSPPSQPAEREEDRNYLMVRMKNEAPRGYQAVKKALENGIAEFKNGKLNFNCDKGTVALIFGESGFTEAKTLARFITINGENAILTTFNNWSKNSHTKEWEKIKRMLFE